MTTDGTPDTAFPWRVHGTMEEWRTKADRKAAVLLSFQGGAFALSVTQSSARMDLGRWPTFIAFALLVTAMCVGAGVILPALGSTEDLAAASATNLIFFGHLRHWSADTLAVALAEVSAADEISMLSAQLVALSRINWQKHRLLQLSVTLTVLAVCLGTVSITATQI